MWNGKLKALTFSYDDGTDSDIRLLEIFEKYGMKCTFNLNGGMIKDRNYITKLVESGKATVNRMALEDMKEYYKGHEIALHGYTHPHLERLSPEMLYFEVMADSRKLYEEFGKKPVGMAYPYGTYSDAVVDFLRENGVKYSRTIKKTLNFDMPSDLLRWNPTCHHKEPTLMELAKNFAEAKPEKPMLFSVWGHSCEFDSNDNWNVIEEFCEYLSNRDDIYYCTNADALLGGDKLCGTVN